MEKVCLTVNGTQEYWVEPGQRLDHILSQVLPLYDLPCGGKGKCGKCRITAQGQLSPLQPAERQWLSPAEIRLGVRLSCQCILLGPAQVQLQPSPDKGPIAMGQAAAFLGSQPFFAQYGAAIDIGTTTIAACLYGPKGQLAQAAHINSQIRYGADVITRLEKSLQGQLPQLTLAIRTQLQQILEELCRTAALPLALLDALVITGNTAMLCFLADLPVKGLAMAPFEAPSLFDEQIAASQLDLACSPECQVYFPPCFSPFVGADTATAILAADMTTQKEPCLLVDIGTNGEMALWKEGCLTCCSVAAGPVFEGAGISMGSRGIPGAIDHVRLEDQDVFCTVIGDQNPPTGICGSGIIDLVALLLSTGAMDETGALQAQGHSLAHRVKNDQAGLYFELPGGVRLTQKDIRAVQLAKSAVCAGIKSLLAQNGLTEGDIHQLFIAGGFGSALDIRSAAAIGLIPPALLEKSVCIGNGALTGAAQVLTNRAERSRLQQLAAGAEILELASHPVFLSEFVEQMLFE